MRAYMKFVTVLGLSVLNWIVYVTVMELVTTPAQGFGLLALGAGTSLCLINYALRFMETSTKTGLGEKLPEEMSDQDWIERAALESAANMGAVEFDAITDLADGSTVFTKNGHMTMIIATSAWKEYKKKMGFK